MFSFINQGVPRLNGFSRAGIPLRATTLRQDYDWRAKKAICKDGFLF